MLFCSRCHKKTNLCKCKAGPLVSEKSRQKEISRDRNKPTFDYYCENCQIFEKSTKAITCKQCHKTMYERSVAIERFKKKQELKKKQEQKEKEELVERLRERLKSSESQKQKKSLNSETHKKLTSLEDDKLLKVHRAVQSLSHGWKMYDQTQKNLVRERDVDKPVSFTNTRREELQKLSDSYLSGLYGLRVIKAWTPSVQQLDIVPENTKDSVYLRDAFDSPQMGGAKALFDEVVKKIKNTDDIDLKKNAVFLVNSQIVVDRMQYLKKDGSISDCSIVGGVPGLYVLQVAHGTMKVGDIQDYLKQTGATPSSYQAYKYLYKKEGEEIEFGKTDNRWLLRELLGGKSLKKLRQLAKTDVPMRDLLDTTVRLLDGLSSFEVRVSHRFGRGVLVTSALKSLSNLLDILAFYGHTTARTSSYYNLIFDELFIILASVRPYQLKDLLDGEAVVHQQRNPVLHLFVETLGVLQRHIHAAWSGMDALVTSLEAAKAVSAEGVQLLGCDEQSNYFEVGLVLAAQLRIAKEGEEPGIIYATPRPSTPLSKPVTPAEIAKVALERVKKLRQKELKGVTVVSLIVDVTIQVPPEEGERSEIDQLLLLIQEPLLSGELQLFLARSYQKYAKLGSGKFMGGCLSLIYATKSSEKSLKYLKGLIDEGNGARDEMQLFIHMLKYAHDKELSYVGKAAKSAEFVAKELLVNGGGYDYVRGLPFVVKQGIMERFFVCLDILKLDSFGMMTSTYLGVVTQSLSMNRVTIGQESRERLIEKFYAVGHLMPEANEKNFLFTLKRPLKQMLYILKDVESRLNSKNPEKIPYKIQGNVNLSEAKLAEDIVKLYDKIIQLRPRDKEAPIPATDLDHVMASYITYMLAASDCIKFAYGQNYTSLLGMPPDDPLLAVCLLLGKDLCHEGLLDRMTSDGRTQFCTLWIVCVANLLDGGGQSKKGLTKFLTAYGLAPNDDIANDSKLMKDIMLCGVGLPRYGANLLKRVQLQLVANSENISLKTVSHIRSSDMTNEETVKQLASKYTISESKVKSIGTAPSETKLFKAVMKFASRNYN